ncbi:phytoene synthase [Niastella koreensis]|uniref:Squalene/phytoene synthase n=2 Tax=Niastella koreensis TaxID=354356 RepID=G8TQJ4_NIAKG|nr:phytoene/squalene synthase family protein [Niastella koreensis]AEW03241.1 Squalene/phytoene synthase [Niastella koreensis GR20-10]OQP55537.1 phytoene synthase [Niastella koreensis]
MKNLFDRVSIECSKITTKTYSTSFTLGILFLDRHLRNPIYAIYGFVRFADEIVDSFHGYNKKELLAAFRNDTNIAIQDRISLNPVLNAFQAVVNEYKIERKWIDIFLDSMEMDLYCQTHDEESYKKYILGSAEAVGLMCLHVFTNGDAVLFERLKPYAMRLGAAFQKVNFLRDAKADNVMLGRTYFPSVNLGNFSRAEKETIEGEIEADFFEALKGIKMLPVSARKGVYLAYYYYWVLFKKIKRLPADRILVERIRIPNFQKLVLMVESHLKYQLNII